MGTLAIGSACGLESSAVGVRLADSPGRASPSWAHAGCTDTSRVRSPRRPRPHTPGGRLSVASRDSCRGVQPSGAFVQQSARGSLPSTRQPASEAGCVARRCPALGPPPRARVGARPRAGRAALGASEPPSGRAAGDARTVRRKVLRTSGDSMAEGHGSAPCLGTRVLGDL